MDLASEPFQIQSNFLRNINLFIMINYEAFGEKGTVKFIIDFNLVTEISKEKVN